MTIELKHPDDMDEWERMKYDELVLDARDEEAAVREEEAAAAARPPAPEVPADAEHTGDGGCLLCGPCEAEFIDGHWESDGCCECQEDEEDEG